MSMFTLVPGNELVGREQHGGWVDSVGGPRLDQGEAKMETNKLTQR